LRFIHFTSFHDLGVSLFPIQLLILDVLLGTQTPDLHSLDKEAGRSYACQCSVSICFVVAIIDLALVHILIDPQFEVFPFIAATEPDTFALFGELFIGAIDEEIVLASVSSVSSHEADVGVNRKQESC
jgi:hypothetical protein